MLRSFWQFTTVLLILGTVRAAPFAEAARKPVDVAFVFDLPAESGEKDLARARTLVGQVFSELPGRSAVSVFVAEASPRLLLAAATDPVALRERLARVRLWHGPADVDAAVSQAMDFLKRRPCGRRLIVLISSGKTRRPLGDTAPNSVPVAVQILVIGTSQVKGGALVPGVEIAGGRYLGRLGEVRAYDVIREMESNWSSQVVGKGEAISPLKQTPPRKPRGRFGFVAVVGLAAALSLVFLARKLGPSLLPSLTTDGAVGGERGSPASRGPALATAAAEEHGQEHAAATLRIESGHGLGNLFALGRWRICRIGHGPWAEVDVPDPTVAPQHCSVEFADGAFRLRALDSGNGTFVNGQPVTEMILQDGDTIRVGETDLRFSLG